MARAPSHITRRGATYQFRRRVPADARSAPFFGGSEHYQQSLGTKDLTEAKRRALTANLKFEAEVEAFRAKILRHSPLVAGRDYVLTQAALEAMQAEWWEEEVSRDRENRRQAARDPSGEWADRMASVDDALLYDVAQSNDPVKSLAARRSLKAWALGEVAIFAETRARRRGIAVGSEEHERITEALAEAHLDATRAKLAASLELPSEPSTAGVKRGLQKGDRPQASWTLRRLAEHVLEQDRAGASWQSKIDQVVTSFEQHLQAPRAISEITKDDVRAFLDLMQNCPDRATMRFPGRSVREAIRLNRALEKPFATLQPNTVRDTHLAVLRSLFTYAVDRDWLPSSPTDKVRIDGSSKKGGRRPSFKVEELAALFALPVFAGCRSEREWCLPGTERLNDHRFWTPLIMLFSGARPSEIGQLAVSDIKTEATPPYISILTEFDPNDPDDFVVSFKTPNARREVPIHGQLVELCVNSERQAKSGCFLIGSCREIRENSTVARLGSAASTES